MKKIRGKTTQYEKRKRKTGKGYKKSKESLCKHPDPIMTIREISKTLFQGKVAWSYWGHHDWKCPDCGSFVEPVWKTTHKIKSWETLFDTSESVYK